jgi:hypothetical protein
MRDILAGGVLAIPDATVIVSRKAAYARRRSVKRGKSAVRASPNAPCNHVQPGQLASPFLKFGFPSLALH